MGYYLINQVKLPFDHKEEAIHKLIMNGYGFTEPFSYRIDKKSVDARKKDQVMLVYNLAVTGKSKSIKKYKNVVFVDQEDTYKNPLLTTTIEARPLIVGTGPAGLFAGLILAEAGARPILFERGESVEARLASVELFFDQGILNPQSNIQFGEGGAGTFSDGKINTGVKDRENRGKKVVEAFIEAGAPEEIAYSAKPHIGTDYLVKVVKNIRERIIALGGEVHFNTRVQRLIKDNQQIIGLETDKGTIYYSRHVVLAIGHSARDTFKEVYDAGANMEAKAFAIGLRIEHPQEMIGMSQYGQAFSHPNMPVADYKLTHRTKKDRAVYSFCMCPGGFVVNAASEAGGLVCNGMSNFLRDEVNANSAMLVNVHPEDFGGDHVLAGVEFQRQLEEKAYRLTGASYKLPIQKFVDFENNIESADYGAVHSRTKGQVMFANLRQVLPEFVSEAIIEGVHEFGKKIKGFDRPDAIMTGVETRSSSPVRILRDDSLQSNLKGLYPCGEGAGYAGGIMSAAMDGIKVAEAIINELNESHS